MHSKVLILGGGMAGIAAAKTLQENGISDFIILEGSHRLGGRVHSTLLGDKRIELGAAWIHGINTNCLWPMAQDCGLQGYMADYDNFTVRNGNGEDVTEKAREVDEKFSASYEKVLDLTKQVIAGEIEDISLRSALEKVGWHPQTSMEHLIERFRINYLYAESADKLCLSTTEVDLHPDQDFFVTDKRGMDQIIKQLTDQVLEENDTRVIFNKVVTEIYYSSDGVQVTTANGEIFESDYAITTFSAGVLQNSVSFAPPLPIAKQTFLKKISMVNYTKTFLKFSDDCPVFWDNTEFIFYENNKNGKYTFWENLAFSGKGSMIAVTHVSPESEDIEDSDDDTIKEEAMAVLREMYPDKTIPSAEKILVTRWSKNGLFGGAYSDKLYHKNGSVDAPYSVEEIDAFNSPVGNLYFAGESFHFMYNGYMQGAYLTGVQQALSVVSRVTSLS